MFFEANNSVLYSDTMIPDVFIAEYLPTMNSDYLKIYIYSLYLGKHNKSATPWEMSKKLGIEPEKVKEGLLYLECEGIIQRDEKKICFVDLKDKEIKKLYRLKTTSSPEDALINSKKNKRKNDTIYAINEKFFQGLMSPAWYTDIDSWFDRFKFDEDVMYTLFQHCYDHNGFSKNYIEKVADNWYARNIKSSHDLDQYYYEFQKTRDISSRITKKLKLGRQLTEYEEVMVEKWSANYKYDFDIIELVLKRTTGKTSPNFNYIHSVLTDWNSKGLKTKEEIAEYTKTISKKAAPIALHSSDRLPNYANFDQREYTEEDLEQYYVKVSE